MSPRPSRTTVVREGRGDKIIVFKYKSKKRYRRTQGHRQDYMYLLVTDIQADGQSLISDEERQRYEAMANRQAKRYEARLMGAYEALGIVATPEAAILTGSSEIEETPPDAE